MKILVVDDNEDNVYQLQVLLSSNGYDVVTATDGAQAFTKAHQSPPDLIIADILMPVMDGFSLCREWKKDEQLRSIPFVFYTATYTDERDKEFALSLGAARFIAKPEEPDVFIQQIWETIHRTERGNFAPPPPSKMTSDSVPIEFPERQEKEFLRQYNQVLVRKLEDKLLQLEQARHELEQDIARRQVAENALRQAHDHLELRVQERTAELQRTNEALESTIAEGRRREQEIQRLNQQLQLRLSELEAANQELESFSYSVSHDLRAPLRSIAGFSNSLWENSADKLDEEGREDLQIIQSAAKRMGQLIDDLLGLSRVTRTKLNREQIDLSALAQSIVDELRRADSARLVEFVCEPLLTAQADSSLLRIALQNLIANAWKFTSKKEQPRIEFGRNQCDDGIAFFVSDNGAGFDMNYADKLFTAFQRLHSSRDFPGTGIGLAIVHHIVQRHGGRVWAKGEPEKGACFYFTLPSSSHPTLPSPLPGPE